MRAIYFIIDKVLSLVDLAALRSMLSLRPSDLLEQERAATHLVDLACEDGSFDELDEAIDNGFSVDALTDIGRGETMLMRACRESYEAVTFLLSKGASVNAESRRGGTPLHYAATYASLPANCYEAMKIIDALLENGASRSIRDRNGDRPYETLLYELSVSHPDISWSHAEEECLRYIKGILGDNPHGS